jgi:hypothetical protein
MRDMRAAATALDFELGERWRAAHDKANRVAHFADLAAEPYAGRIAAFPLQLDPTNTHLAVLMKTSVEDVEALLEMGLRALENVAERGQDTGAPALALWREYHHARETMLAQMEPVSA